MSASTGVLEGAVPVFTMGDRIRKARRHRTPTVTQERVAAALTEAGLATTSQAVANWETGMNDVHGRHRALVAEVVARLTGVSEQWLREGGAERPPNPPATPAGSLVFLPPSRPTNPCLSDSGATVLSWRPPSRALVPVRAA